MSESTKAGLLVGLGYILLPIPLFISALRFDESQAFKLMPLEALCFITAVAMISAGLLRNGKGRSGA